MVIHWSWQTRSSNNTRDDSTHGHHQMVNTKIRLIIFFAAQDGEALYSQQKQDQELTCSDHELLIAKCRLKLKKVGKTTRPFSSVQFSRSVLSNSLPPHESQHARPPCPSPTPKGHPNSCPLSRWCHPAISPSVVPFASCPQFLPASKLFQWVNSLHEGAKVWEFQL